jgi:lipopolysaccharide export system protein LptC
VIWRVFIVFMLLLVAAMSVMMSRREAEPESAAPAREPPQLGYYMTDARVTETGPDGRPRYRIEAERVLQNPFDLSIRLEELRLGYSADADRRWTLTAEAGYVPPGSRTIDLSGNVVIVGKPQPGAETAVVRTERLSLDTEANIATTPARVDIEWGRRRLSGIGLKADLKAERVQLESAVHGRFAR